MYYPGVLYSILFDAVLCASDNVPDPNEVAKPLLSLTQQIGAGVGVASYLSFKVIASKGAASLGIKTLGLALAIGSGIGVYSCTPSQ